MPEFRGGRYIGLSRTLDAVAIRAHNAHVPADREGDVCTCTNCSSTSCASPRRAPETGPAVRTTAIAAAAGPASLADVIERDMQDRLREQDEAERCKGCLPPRLALASASCPQCLGDADCGSAALCAAVAAAYAPAPGHRGPVQDESGRLDIVDAAAMRAVEGVWPTTPVNPVGEA